MASASTVMIVVIAITVAVIASAIAVTSTVTTSATAALTAQAIDKALYLVLCSLATLKNLSREAEGLSRKRMIEVHLHLVVGNLKNTSVETVAILILQGHDGILEDILMIEMSVDAEHLAFEVEDACSLTIAVCLVLVELKLKVGTSLKTYNLLLKLLESNAKST